MARPKKDKLKGRKAKRVWRRNFFGEKPGVIDDGRGNEIKIKYSASGERMICTAWLKDGRQCGMWTEPHRDKCKMHGGRMLEVRKEKGLRVSGARSKYAVPLKQKFKELADSPKLKTLKDEIVYLRVFLDQKLRRLSSRTSVSQKEQKEIAWMIGEIRKCVESQVKIEDGLKLTIDVGQLNFVVAQIYAILREEITDHGVINRIGTRLDKLRIPDARGVLEKGDA